MREGEWFRILSGEHEGRWHLCGWKKTAIKVLDGGDSHGWLALSACPRCSAIVIADDRHPYGDCEWSHEQWHAATDYPLPTETQTGPSTAGPGTSGA